MHYLIKNLLIALVITMVLASAYYFLSSKNTGIEEFAATEITPSVKQQTEKILLDTQRINELTLDDGIFSDIRFTSLINTRVSLREVPTGRSNPFESAN